MIWHVKPLLLLQMFDKISTHWTPNSTLDSVQFSHSVMSHSLRTHGPQHSRLPCSSPTPGAYSNSCPSCWWFQPTISSSVFHFSSLLQSFPASGSFQMSQFFTSGGQSIEISASVLPMNIQNWFPLGLTGLISLQFKGLSRVFSNTTVQKHWFFGTQFFLQSKRTPKSFKHHTSKASVLWRSAFFIVQLSYPYMTTGKTIALTRQTFIDNIMSLLFNMLSRLVIAFLLRSKHLLISWMQSPSAMILEPKI